jgi:hypothetical protein
MGDISPAVARPPRHCRLGVLALDLGLPGAFIAMPLLATLKFCCDHIERLEPLGDFLGR